MTERLMYILESKPMFGGKAFPLESKMGSRERMLKALDIGEPDMMPVAPYVGSWYAPRLCGLRISEYTLGNNRKRAEILMEAQRKFGYDWIMAGEGHPHGWRRTVRIRDAGSSYLVINKHNGTTRVFPKDDVPHTPFGEYKFEDVEKIPIQDHRDILRSGAFEPVETISKRVGKKILVSHGVTCPWSTSRRWTGLIEWIKALYRTPDLPEKVMKHAFEHNLEHAKASVEAGAQALWVEEGSVGTDTIPPKFYEKLAFPYEYQFIRKLRELGVPAILSVTGNVMPILDKIIETNADAHHFEESKKGFAIDVSQIRERLRGRKCFFVPFDQVNLLRTGNLEAVRNGVIDIIWKTAPGGGVVLSTGSPVLRDTPVRNFEMMIRTARAVGTYPIQLQNPKRHDVAY